MSRKRKIARSGMAPTASNAASLSYPWAKRCLCVVLAGDECCRSDYPLHPQGEEKKGVPTARCPYFARRLLHKLRVHKGRNLLVCWKDGRRRTWLPTDEDGFKLQPLATTHV